MKKSPTPKPQPPTSVRYVLPWPPSVNDYWRPWRGRMVLSQRGRDFRNDVLAVVLSAWTRPTFRGPIAITVTLYQSRRGAKCDVDNFSKGIFDALAKAGVYENDRQVDDQRTIRGPRCDDPRAEVLIVALER